MLKGFMLTVLIWGVSAAFAAAPQNLTNLSHLNFLTQTITPPEQAGHSTYRLAENPELLALWTYAEPEGDSETYRRVGGGDYDAATDTWGQGAFNADDLTRAAIVYLRHWQQTGAASSRASAYELLRTVAYLQTLTPGPNQGNVVLWLQPDGTLNPSAEPVEQPDPSDSGASYWLARTVWALGEGYAAFAEDDPNFAAFLEARLELALGALERQVLVNYPKTETFHGFQNPTWLINGGADASSEAMYGLAAYLRVTSNSRAERALRQFADGLMLLTSRTPTAFPFGATLPWTGSRSLWHGWGAQMAGALAVAGDVLGEPELIDAARSEMSTFVPLLLVQGGADQGWTPTPAETVQIAYGADAALHNLLTVADLTGERVFEQLAGIAGAWYFGNNRATTPLYDVTTGRTFDGLEADGRINSNSGAESTVHGLLSMLALDAHPDVKAAAYGATRVLQKSWQLVEAESGTLTNGEVVTPESAWNGEASWSGGAYVTLSPGGQLELEVTLPETGRYAVLPVFERQPVLRFATGADITLGGQPYTFWLGGAGDPGVSSNEGLLTVVLANARGTTKQLGAGTVPLRVSSSGDLPVQLDAFLVRPEVARLDLTGSVRQTLLQSFAPARRVVTLEVPRSAKAFVYDGAGTLTETVTGRQGRMRVPVPAGGFSYLVTSQEVQP